MKAHIADEKWDKAEKVIQEKLKEQLIAGFSEGMKTCAKSILEKLNNHAHSTNAKLKEIQEYVNWCLNLKNNNE